MKGHPLHGTNPLAKKLTLRAQGTTTGTEIWKILWRVPGGRAWTCEKVTSPKMADDLAIERRAEGKEARISRL